MRETFIIPHRTFEVVNEFYYTPAGAVKHLGVTPRAIVLPTLPPLPDQDGLLSRKLIPVI
ncbi:hypothetical protein J6590_102580 [Homalodisca vitripennis]|nr:hypothetical protein J6590_102580 [Homalodisca vitripennis]